jgi:hypothetical protein
MHTGLNNTFLYTASRIETVFQDDLGKKIPLSGTGFFVLNDKDQYCLVTNRHVVDLNYKEQTNKYSRFKLTSLTIYSKWANEGDNDIPVNDNIFHISNLNEIKFCAKIENDIAVIVNIRFFLSHPNEERELGFKLPYSLLATREKIAKNLQVSHFVAFPGFPEWYDRFNNIPILRTGTISSDPRLNYSNTTNYMGDCIEYEAFSFGGSSGSPVFAMQIGRKGGNIIDQSYREVMLVGINAGHLSVSGSGQHSGISFFYKSYLILDMINAPLAL